MEKIRTYDQFWPFYLGEHSNPLNRKIHFVGTSIGLILLALSFCLGNFWLVPAAIVVGYAFAWVGHFVIEKNRPATFQYPLWSFVSDWKMWFLMLTRQPLLAKKSDGSSKPSL